MLGARFQPGDWVVYEKQKFSDSPGKRAHGVSPASAGDTYSYIVAKFWVVKELVGDNAVLLKTRRGKEHVVELSDPKLRRAHWWEKLVYRGRFRDVAASTGHHAAS